MAAQPGGQPVDDQVFTAECLRLLHAAVAASAAGTSRLVELVSSTTGPFLLLVSRHFPGSVVSGSADDFTAAFPPQPSCPGH